MLEQEIVVSNKLGLHARASAKLVQLVQGFKSTVWLVSKGREINAQSIMGVMMLAAGIGTPLTIRVDGPNGRVYAGYTPWPAVQAKSSTKRRLTSMGIGNREVGIGEKPPARAAGELHPARHPFSHSLRP